MENDTRKKALTGTNKLLHLMVMTYNNILTIDIGGTYIKYGMVNAQFEITNREKFLTPPNLKEFICEIQKLIDSFKDIIDGVSFSLPGNINSKQKIIDKTGAVTYLNSIDLNEVLNFYELDYAIENDANCGLICESNLGHLRQFKNGALIVLGTGIGGALLIDNKLYTGTRFNAGELGLYLTSDNQFLETTSSASSLISKINENENISNKLDGEYAFQKILEKDSEAFRHFEQFSINLVNFITNLAVIMDIDAVVISGGISEQTVVKESLQYKLDAQFANTLVGEYIRKPKLFVSDYYNDANLLGAYLNITNKYNE